MELSSLSLESVTDEHEISFRSQLHLSANLSRGYFDL